MSAYLSDIINGLQKVGASLVHSGKAHYREVAAELGDLVAPALREGQAKPDFEAFQLGLVSLVENELDTLLTFDESHVSELDDDREQLAERNAAFPELFDQLSGVQKACEGVYGEAASVNLFGGVEALPQDPVKLQRIGERVQSRLADPAYRLPRPRLRGWQMRDRKKLAAGLKRPVDRLDKALDTLGGERKSSDGTLLRKQRAIERARRTLRFGAVCLAALYSLAGFDEWAAKVRPRRRTPRRRSDEPEPPPSPEASSETPPEGDGGSDAGEGSGPTLVVS